MKKEINKIDMENYEAIEFMPNTYDGNSLKLKELAEKINEIIEYLSEAPKDL